MSTTLSAVLAGLADVISALTPSQAPECAFTPHPQDDRRDVRELAAFRARLFDFVPVGAASAGAEIQREGLRRLTQPCELRIAYPVGWLRGRHEVQSVSAADMAVIVTALCDPDTWAGLALDVLPALDGAVSEVRAGEEIIGYLLTVPLAVTWEV